MCLQASVEAEVQALLALKKQYKEATGQECKPGAAPPTPASNSKGDDAGDLDSKIRSQGDKVRQLKADKAPKVNIFSPT